MQLVAKILILFCVCVFFYFHGRIALDDINAFYLRPLTFL